jgi:hypothetical protein
MNRLVSKAVTIAIIVAMTFVLFFVVEGCSGALLLMRNIVFTPKVAERAHTTYDPVLGWINVPNTYLPNQYGPGIYLRINSQGFRNNQDFTQTIPEGRVRVICSGDSFTLGYSVNNDEPWCQRLVADDARLETVNMGQGGYGADQAFLWYVRDGVKLDHDVQIFAFIEADFHRMMRSKFYGYAKPRLKLEDGRVVVTNTPVSSWGYHFPKLARAAPYFNQLRTLQLLGGSGEAQGTLEEEQALGLRIIERLQELQDEHQRTLLVVFLPTRFDYDGDSARVWRAFLARELGRRKIAYLDLVAELKALPRAQVNEMFIGHYSAVGNQWVADRIAPLLHSLPAVAAKLARIPRAAVEH